MLTDDTAALNDRLGWAWMSGDTAQADLDAAAAQYNELTAEELLDAAQTVFRPENLTIAVQYDPETVGDLRRCCKSCAKRCKERPMPSQIYEILSLMMRYWFAALGVLIVLRAFWWLWKDHRSREKKRRSLPDAGSIGEFVVESDCAALPQDTLLPVPADGTLGSVRSCDIVVPARGVSPGIWM